MSSSFIKIIVPSSLTIFILCCSLPSSNAFASIPLSFYTTSPSPLPSSSSQQQLSAMKRPILDQIATTVFNLEQTRVESSSVIDSKGRMGEPMEWSEKNSFANQFSEIIASNSLGYMFKQFVADLVAGEYDQEAIEKEIELFVNVNANDKSTSTSTTPSLFDVSSFFGVGESTTKNSNIAMFSFTTCPFCRQAKDYFDENGIQYNVMELDELEGNKGNEIRATLGRMTKRTSVPSIFINGVPIGGLNDGMPGLMPLVNSGELKKML